MSENTPHRTRLRDRLRAAVTPPGDESEPLWVRAFADLGRPLVTVVVLIMCAPGEHRLGVMAGWSPYLAWGLAAVLAAYAGIAAVVAGRRRKGAHGRVTSIIGAVVALLLGMAAQPIAHLYVTGVWKADPHDTVWLIVGVSCVPALVLAHLLHLAAGPRPVAAVPAVPAAAEQLLPDDIEDQEPQEPQEPAEPSPYAAEVWLTIPQAAKAVGRAESTIRGWLADPGRGLRTRQDADGRRLLIDASTLPPVQLSVAG